MIRSNHFTRRFVAVIAVVVGLAGTTLACSPEAGIPPAGLDCAWGILGSKSALNVAYPDTAATYWGMKLNVIAGDRVIVEGTFPQARYANFVTYGPTGSAVDSVTDRDLVAQSGTNPFSDPFSDPGSNGGTYRVEISNDWGPATAGNHLATGGVLGSVLYRVYLPTPAAPGAPVDPTGGVGLPQVSVQRADGSVVHVSACASPGADSSIVDLINLAGPATDQPAAHPPLFRRPAALAGLYANPDNAYVAAVSAHQAGSVLVVRGTAPTVPNTEGEASPTTPSQLRFWSVCSNEYRKPYPVSFCVHDTEVPVDGQGAYTIVVSTAADRPSNATTANGYAWLEWGSTSQDMVLILRNMLPASSFQQSVFDVTPGAAASTAMGQYSPVASECTASEFETSAGDLVAASACGLA